MRKNIMAKSVLVALALLILSNADVKSVLGAGFVPRSAAQDSKDSKADKQAQAAKKYLEAKRLEDTGNYPGAVSAYKEAIALDPESVDLRVTLGALYLKNRNVIDAEAQAREATRLAPDNIEVRKLLARIYLTQTFVGTNLNKEKVRATIKELEEIMRIDPKAKIELPNEREPVPALTLIGGLYLAIDDQDKALEALKKVSENDVSSDEAHYQLADLYYKKNKFREAAVAARKAYDINQKTPEPRKTVAYAGLLARSLLRIGRTQEAIDIYKKAIGIKDTKDSTAKGDDDDIIKGGLPTSPLIFDYAEALVYSGRYDEATKLLDPLIKNIRKDTPIYLEAVRLQTDALKRAGKRDEAIRLLEDSLKGQDVSESIALLYSLADTYEETLQFEKAIPLYEEALASIVNPDGTVNNNEGDKNRAGIVLQRIGLAYRLSGKRDKAMETFERMKKVLGTDSPRGDQLIVDTLITEGKYKEALDAASAAVGKFPDERSFKLYKAQAASKLGDMQTADQTLRGLLKNGPEDADVYLYWSSVQLEANQLKEAEDSVRKAIELEPRDIGPLITLASVQDRQKKYKESEATLRKALEIDPDNATILNNLGYFLADRNERLPEAEALIRRAVNIEPTNGSFLDSLGWLLFRQNKLAEAQKYLEQAVIYSARSATVHDHLGDLYKKQGQTDKAREKWEEALKLATEPDEIKKIKEKLGKK